MLQGHANAVLEAHWSEDMQHIYSCSADKSVAMWDAETGQRVKKMSGHMAIVNSMNVLRSTVSVLPRRPLLPITDSGRRRPPRSLRE